MMLKDELLAIVNMIEDDLFASWMLDDLSQQAYVSKYHLHRIFRAVSGRTPTEYLWLRRLSVSLESLHDSMLTITDIAIAHGFADSSSYTHAFKRQFGITPSAYRKRPTVLPICDRLHPYDLVGDEQGVLLRPQVVMHPGFSVIGERYPIRYGENADTNRAYHLGSDFYFHRRQRVLGALEPSLYTGLTIFPEDDDSFTWYIPSLEVPPGTEPPPGMERIDIPPRTCAAFRYAGMHDVSEISARMRPLFEHIYLVWMPQLSQMRIPMNYERIPWTVCSEEYCEIVLLYALQPARERKAAVPGARPQCRKGRCR